jgi:hypothetical protein
MIVRSSVVFGRGGAIMTLRAVGVFVGGIVIWSALFWIVGIAFGLAWPDYSAAAQLFFANQDFSLFTVPMMLTNFVLFTISGLASGWIVVTFGRNRKAGLALAALGLAYGLFEHYYLLWNVLPDWYNLVVPWIMGGSIYLGTRLASLKQAA